MSQIIKMPDGKDHIVIDLSDFLWLVDEYMGMEARSWLEEYLSETYGEADEIETLVDYYEKKLADRKEAAEEIRKEAEKLSGLICKKDLDRKAISGVAGRIGTLTYREVNRL